MIRSSKKNYFVQKFGAVKDSCKIWDLFNELTNFRRLNSMPITKLVTKDNREVENEVEIAALFAKEYIITESASDLKDLDERINDYDCNYTDHPSSDVQPAEILAAIRGIKKCKPDVHSIPKKVYKCFADCFIIPLSMIFMSIIKTGVVPEMLKEADCFPLYKGKGKLNQASSYRAIFNLSCFTKIFERFLYNRLVSLCSEKMNDKQHGFRRGRSCETAVATFS